MRICIAQTHSLKGDIENNIQKHVKFIQLAIAENANFIVFPELSITNYEPELATEMATQLTCYRFNTFQEIADKKGISISIGMPLKTQEGVQISMFIFQPKKDRVSYSKQMLHTDETPYFVAGNQDGILHLNGIKIALGICFETLQTEHFTQANKLGADIYLASVAKPENGIQKAYQHFPKMAKKWKMPVLMANCIGACDQFTSVGQSAVWNKTGTMISQLDAKSEGLLIFDTQTETVRKVDLS